jgi:hypothetical protein
MELLFWAGCPSYPAALGDLRAEGFVGSPTIRAGGVDVVPPPPGEPSGLTCRVYRRRDGRFSPLPDPDDLRDALRDVLQERSPA